MALSSFRSSDHPHFRSLISYNKTTMPSQKDKNKKSIFYAAGDYGASGWYRCHVPGVELKRKGHRVVLEDKASLSKIVEFEIVIMQRHHDLSASVIIDKVKNQGGLTVYELDDDIWNVEPSNPGYEFWTQKKVVEGAERCIRASDIVTTSTDYLASLLKDYNKNVFVIPNMLPSSFWRIRKSTQKKSEVVIAWAGGVHHKDNLKMIVPVLMRLIDEYPKLNINIASTAEEVFPKHNKIHIAQRVPVEKFPTLFADSDIGIAPMIDNEFNRSKSDLKFLENSILGVPCVASNVESYKHSVIHGENGFLAGSKQEWLKYLRQLIEDRKLRGTMGLQAKKFAEARTIEKNIGLWEEAYGIG